jgi:hypothetical protein
VSIAFSGAEDLHPAFKWKTSATGKLTFGTTLWEIVSRMEHFYLIVTPSIPSECPASAAARQNLPYLRDERYADSIKLRVFSALCHFFSVASPLLF